MGQSEGRYQILHPRITGTKFFFLSFLLLGLILSAPHAFASSNVPLQSWVYDHLERLVNTGLVDHASLAMKPLSRQAVAEILAQVIHKIEKNEETYGFRNALVEDQLATLVEEFKWELQRMGAYPLGEQAEAKWYSLKPLDTAQIKLGYAEDPFLLENSMADRLAHGFNLRVGGTSRVELADYLSLFVHPEYRYDRDQNKGYLLETYGKLTLFNVELEAGRDSQWWGPGYHGSLLLSRNALPLDLVKLSSATPFQLPWIFRYLGYFEFNFFLSQLEEDRDLPHAKLTGMRLNYAPAPFLELGFSRVILFGGEGRPAYSLGDYWNMVTTTHSQAGPQEQKFDTDQIYSCDVTLRLRNIGRYFPLATSIALYGEFGGEDMPGKFTVIPRSRGIRDANPGYIGGILLQDLFTLEGLDFRAEYARTNQVWYRHHLYTSGYTYKGVIIGHHMGGNSDDLYLRLSHWLNKNFQVALDFDQERHGLTRVPKPLPGQGVPATTVQVRERYLESSLLLFRPVDIPLSATLACRVIQTKNADFERGENHTNYLLRLECSYEF